MKDELKLDYATIKSDIADMLSASPVFQDYDNTGRTMQVLLSILARNTEINGLYAGLSVIESNPRTARLLSSLNAHAMIAGILPIQKHGARASAIIDLNFSSVINYLPVAIGDIWGTADSRTVVVSNYTLLSRSSSTHFRYKIDFIEGSPVTQYLYIVPENTPIVITDPNIDITTLKCSTNGVSIPTNVPHGDDLFDAIPQLICIAQDSGKYEVLANMSALHGSTVKCDFISTSGEAGNAILVSGITPPASKYGGQLSSFTVTADSGTKFVGGRDQYQTLEELRSAILLGRDRKGRLATASDYKSFLAQMYPGMHVFSVTSGNIYTGNRYGEIAIFAMNKPATTNTTFGAYTKIDSVMKQRMIGEMYKVNALLPIVILEPEITVAQLYATDTTTGNQAFPVIDANSLRTPVAIVDAHKLSCTLENTAITINSLYTTTKFEQTMVFNRKVDSFVIDNLDSAIPYTMQVTGTKIFATINGESVTIGSVIIGDNTTTLKFNTSTSYNLPTGLSVGIIQFGEWQKVTQRNSLEFFEQVLI